MKTALFLLLLPAILHADLVVSGGHLILAGGVMRETTETTVQSSATLRLDSGTELITPLLTILTSGKLRGCGTVTGAIDNQGLIETACGTGSTLVLSGDLTNSGVIRAENNTGFTVTGSFANNGLLDLIFSPSVMPAGITGNGEVVTAATLPPIILHPDINRLEIPMYTGHSYQIQYTDDLGADPVVWIHAGAPFSVPFQSTQLKVIELPATGLRMYRYVMQ